MASVAVVGDVGEFAFIAAGVAAIDAAVSFDGWIGFWIAFAFMDVMCTSGEGSGLELFLEAFGDGISPFEFHFFIEGEFFFLVAGSA